MKMKFLKSAVIVILTSLSGVALGNIGANNSIKSVGLERYVVEEPNPYFTMKDLGFCEELNRTKQKAHEVLKAEWNLSQEELENGLDILTNMFQPEAEKINFISISDKGDKGFIVSQ